MRSSHLPNWNEPENEAPSVIKAALVVVIMAAAGRFTRILGWAASPARH